MAPHSSTLAWKIPWTEEPGRLQSMGSLESDTTEQLHFHFSLSCIGEGNGNPLQCSCLENPRDGKPGGLPSMGSHRVWHDWSDLAAAAADFHSTLILKTLKASLALLILDVQHALPFPWNSLLSCVTPHTLLLVISCSPLALSLVLFSWTASLSLHPWFRYTSASIAPYTTPYSQTTQEFPLLDWEFTGGRRHTCHLRLDPSPQHGALQRPGCQSLCVKGVRCPCLVMGKPVVLRLETEAPDLVASLRVEDELGKNLQRETGDVPDW